LLRHTFIHIQGIGPKSELRLWRQGITTWEMFLDRKGTIFSPARDSFIRGELEQSLVHRDDITFFSDRLSSAHLWRLFEAFSNRVVYLDIETSGGYQGLDEITVVGTYDGREVKTFVSGYNLDEFEQAIHGYQIIITFNGGSFDLPCIRRHFPGIQLPPVHIDLFPLMARLGYRGGLKSIEKQLAIAREAEIEGMNGYDAVRLWAAYQWGDEQALSRLIKYNTADIVNLQPLMEVAYEKMKERLFGQCPELKMARGHV